MVLTAGDCLSAYVPEWTLHHLDLVAHVPRVGGPPAEGLARTREMIAGSPFPALFADTDALLIGTGRLVLGCVLRGLDLDEAELPQL